MDHNPYSPPAASVADALNVGRLYSPRQIFAASFLGSPIAATWLIYRNLATLGRESYGRRILWIGIAATIAMSIVAMNLPKQVPGMLVPIVYSVALYQYALHLFKSAYHDHLIAAGRTGSWWSVIGISLLAELILVGVLFAIVFVFPG